MKKISTGTCFLCIACITLVVHYFRSLTAPALSDFFLSTAQAEDVAGYEQNAWYIRLSAAMPSAGLMDSANTLGLDPEASLGPDLLDIPEQPRPQWVENYLELVFPHPEWEEQPNDLSSDFRKADAVKSKTESWYFEVRSNILGEEINLSWHGSARTLAGCQLRDGKTGEILVSDPLHEGYTFTLTENDRTFIFEYNYMK
ncbi:MAG: hypothetical protein C4563_01650 [Desulfobulbus sp.]|nr:MAG: hypothetical protein C4563_01650 [Desulfobulbus sp.]